MTFTRFLALSFLLPLGLAAGCAGGKGGYPSLAPRAVERVEMTAAPASPAESSAAAAPAVAMPASITAIVTAAQAADKAFRGKLTELRPAIAAGRSAAAGSEQWIVAQQAYSAVEIARGGIGSALADLDRIHQQAVAAGDAARQSAVEAAIREVQAIDDAAQAALAAVQPAGA